MAVLNFVLRFYGLFIFSKERLPCAMLPFARASLPCLIVRQELALDCLNVDGCQGRKSPTHWRMARPLVRSAAS